MLERMPSPLSITLRKVGIVGAATIINIALWAYPFRFLIRFLGPPERAMPCLLGISFFVFVGMLSVAPSSLPWGWRRVAILFSDGLISFVIFCTFAMYMLPNVS
jgi:hypothetical protein